MTELDEFLKKQELENAERMDYILRPEDTLPTEDQCGFYFNDFWMKTILINSHWRHGFITMTIRNQL